MLLKVLFDNRYRVAAPSKEKGDELAKSDVEKFMGSSASQHGKHVTELWGLIHEFSENGSLNLTQPQFHKADTNTGLLRFAKGRLRIYCMIDEDEKLVLLTGGMVKKSQETDAKSVMNANAKWKRYQTAKSSNNIDFRGEEI